MQPFQMNIEKDGSVKPHGFHLGTDRKVAETFVIEQLKNGAESVALIQGGKTVKIFDYRDIS